MGCHGVRGEDGLGMSRLSFEENFFSKGSVVPDLVVEHFKSSSWRKDDIALALLGTKIVSIRILQEDEQVQRKVHHIVLPIEPRNSAGIPLETPVRAFSDWVTIDNGKSDVSYRVSLLFQDAISLDVDYKNSFKCDECENQQEECFNVFDEDGEMSAFEKSETLAEPWWEDSWDGSESETPRLFNIDVCYDAVIDFNFHIAHAVANSISRSSFESMTKDSELLPLFMVDYFWSELSKKVRAL